MKSFRRIGMSMLILFSGPLTALEFTDAFVRGLPPGQKNTAAFFTVANAGARAWTITRVTSDAADRVEMHRHEHNNGMMRMREVDTLTIEAQSSLQFAPGGLHLMLIGLKQALREGDRVTLQFINDAGESATTEFPVISVVNEHRHH